MDNESKTLQIQNRRDILFAPRKKPNSWKLSPPKEYSIFNKQLIPDSPYKTKTNVKKQIVDELDEIVEDLTINKISFN